MQLIDLRSLILDALYDRRKPKSKSCLGVNEAGIELFNHGKDILPLIEKVIEAEVIPKARSSPFDETTFPGLPYVFGAYLVVSSKTGNTLAINFLRNLPEALLPSAVFSVPTFFRVMSDGYNFGVPPFDPLISYLRELAGSRQDEVGIAAKEYLQTRK
jgi:hypothetical protein